MGGVNEETEFWKEVRKDRKVRAATRRYKGQFDLMQLESLGYDVKAITEYQWRINDAIDIFPTNNRYHNLNRNSRGHYRNLITFISSMLPL